MSPAARKSDSDQVPETDLGEAAPLLVFVHIPKTAGTTLTTILKHNHPPPRIRSIGNVFKGGGGLNKEATFDHLRADGGSGLGEVRLLTGHVPLGIRKYLPEGRQLRPFTMLREPKDRTLSHYFQIRDRRGGVEGPTKPKLELGPLSADATLEETLEAGYTHDNVQTRMLSGIPDPFGKVTDEMLERAKRNLREELVFFGLTERFDESLVLAKQRLGLRSLMYRSPDSARSARRRSAARATGRVSTTRPRGDDVPEELMRAAEACNRYDIELYRYAEELFDRELEREGVDLEVEVAALRAARSDGELDLDIPRPDGFGGDERAWRQLLEAKAAQLRNEHELAEVSLFVSRLGASDGELLDELARMKVQSKLTAGRDPDTTSYRVIATLATIGSAVRAERRKQGRAQAKSTPPAAGSGSEGGAQGVAGSTATRSSRSGSSQRSSEAAGSRSGSGKSSRGQGAGSRKRKPRTGRASGARAGGGRSGRKSGQGSQPSASSARKPRKSSRARRSSAGAAAGGSSGGRGAKARRRAARDSKDG